MMIRKNALDKLDAGAKEKINDKYGAVIKTYVHSALAGFCKQNESFAQAVINGGTFAECIKYCTDGIGGNTGISDIDIYRRAVQFYFPGARVDFKIQIMTDGAETIIHEEPEREKVKTKTKTAKTEEAITKTEETKLKTFKLKRKTEKIEQKTAEPKRKNTKSERKTKKQDSNIIQLDLFA
ncbi:MAG: hypothetical protein IJD56_04655, partial [Peptococcaceae bacterium]|nr:hypothetical protein [Peptococcaceae bacterium]